jgi:glycosyltransferase involved in cell wall biosynthesis
MAELVSIYLPTRNRRRLLERAVTSVLRQTYEEFQLVVVNDASTDDTHDYLDDLASREPRLIALHMESPVGAPAARNRAIGVAKGSFATGLDDDDEFCDDRISIFVNRWSQLGRGADHISCLFSKSVMVDGITDKITTDRKDQVSFSDLFVHNYIGNQVFCPTERLVDIGCFDEMMPAWQDLELFMRLTRRYGDAHLVPRATYKCHIERGRERISSDIVKLRLAYDKITQKHSELPPELYQQLFLQLFSPFYGTVPSTDDWKKMMGLGIRPEIIVRLLRATVRNQIKRYAAEPSR